jgi:hypothetical protein
VDIFDNPVVIQKQTYCLYNLNAKCTLFSSLLFPKYSKNVPLTFSNNWPFTRHSQHMKIMGRWRKPIMRLHVLKFWLQYKGQHLLMHLYIHAFLLFLLFHNCSPSVDSTIHSCGRQYSGHEEISKVDHKPLTYLVPLRPKEWNFSARCCSSWCCYIEAHLRGTLLGGGIKSWSLWDHLWRSMNSNSLSVVIGSRILLHTAVLCTQNISECNKVTDIIDNTIQTELYFS